MNSYIPNGTGKQNSITLRITKKLNHADIGRKRNSCQFKKYWLQQNMEDTEKELAAKKQYCEEMFKKGTDNPSERDEVLGELKTISTEILTLEKKMSQLTELWHKNQEALRTANMAMHSLPGYEEPEETTEFILHIPEGYRVDIMTDNPSVIS